MIRVLKSKAGSALVEYGLLIAGVALVGAAAVSIFGHKTNDLIATTAAVLPGAHEDDNGPIVSGKVLETTRDPNNGDAIILDPIAAGQDDKQPRLGNNLLGTGFGSVLGTTLVIEAN